MILMTRADGDGCAFYVTHPPARPNKLYTRTHVHQATNNTHKLCCHSVGRNCAGWWVFLSPTVCLSIYISLQDQRIHPSLTSLLTVCYSVTFLSQPACNESSTLLLVKWKSTIYLWQITFCTCNYVCAHTWGELKEMEIHPVPFPLSPHYKSLRFSECTDGLRRVFHLKMELMPWLRLQITLQILIIAAWQMDLSQWTLALLD